MATSTNTTLLTVKMDKKLKKEAQKVAAEMGLPLSAIVNAKLREVVQERHVSFSLPLEPNAETQSIIDQSEKDFRAGKHTHGPFASAKEAVAFLDTL